jgi:hypothetical protein
MSARICAVKRSYVIVTDPFLRERAYWVLQPIIFDHLHGTHRVGGSTP